MAPHYDHDIDAQAWTRQESLKIGKRPRKLDCLLKLQSLSTIDMRAALAVCETSNPDSAKISNENVHFQIMPAPVNAAFRIELAPWYPEYQKKPKDNAKELKDYEEKRLKVEFSAYVDGQLKTRTPTSYKHKDDHSPPASGPIDFSDQLYEVRYCDGNNTNVPKALRDLGYKHVFVWKAKDCAKYGFSQPFPPSKKAQVDKFIGMIDTALKKQHYFFVGFKEPRIANHHWPYFTAAPTPFPPSWFPWVDQLQLQVPEYWTKAMNFERIGSHELHPRYIDHVLADRGNQWYENGQALPVVRANVDTANLDKVIKFRDGRQYLATILGSFAYEELYTKDQVRNHFNGWHRAEVYSEAHYVQGTRKYVVLLNLNPPVDASSGLQTGLPEVGELVEINVKYGGLQQVWRGQVIELPPRYKQLRRNTAVLVYSQPFLPSSGRIVLDYEVVEGEFHFGHHGQNTLSMKQDMMALMFDRFQDKDGSNITSQWFKEVLLARDSHRTLSEAQTQNHRTTSADNQLPPRFRGASGNTTRMMQHIRSVCQARHLNDRQRDIVEHYFSHRITLVRGPPGTGKSTLIDVISQLEEEFHQTYWICTESNEAADVLVRKTTQRHGTFHPKNLLRVRTMADTRLDYTVEGTKISVKEVLQDPTSTGDALRADIERILTESGNMDKAMNLENLIKRRILLRTKGDRNELYRGELEEQMALRDAAVAFQSLGLEAGSGNEFEKQQKRLENIYYQALRSLQSSYVNASRGIYSTAAAGNGKLMRAFHPDGMIMDEASQFMEAKAVGAVLKALKGGKLKRILLIGDDFQLPPTAMSDRNPFKETAVVSLLERLVESGAPIMTLRTQFRMHPTISRVCIEHVYGVRDIILDNHPSTRQQNGQVDYFRKFVQLLAQSMGNQKISDQTNSIMISPAKPEPNDIPWNAQQATGSTSRFNLTTARIAVHVVLRLLGYGYDLSHIMVISFYTDQVLLLKAIFKYLKWNGKTLRDLQVTTIDGSQGQENRVVIVDTVVQGDANGDSLGFLASEFRRFNVAMSRAQAGRIVIANRHMVKYTNTVSNVWTRFINEHSERIPNFAMLQGEPFNTKVPKDATDDFDNNKEMISQMNTFFNRSKNSAKVPQLLQAEPNRRPIQNYDEQTFIQVTGAKLATAQRYLRDHRELSLAIDKYLDEHGSDNIVVEEIPRQ